ncbi:MAG: hypothetical protein ACFCUU_11855 [Cyclobacteriaceae bacterium]
MTNLRTVFKACFLSVICSLLLLQSITGQDFPGDFSQLHGKLKASINQYDYDRHNLLIRTESVIPDTTGSQLHIDNTQWSVTYGAQKVDGSYLAWDLQIRFQCQQGELQGASLSVELEFDDWSTDNYVLLPAAAYNGNRFPFRRISYSPKLLDPRDIGPDIGTILTDIPKLNEGAGPSRIQERTGGMSVPSAGFFSPSLQKSFWMLTKQATRLGDSGIDIEENRDRSKAIIRITAPVVRELYKYRITDSRWPSDDKPANFKAGDSLTIAFRLYFSEASKIQDLYDVFFDVRKSLHPADSLRTILPFSAAFDVQEAKFNRENFVPDFGYYAVGMRENFLQDWQIGWTGGMITTFPLLHSGSAQSRQNVLRNFAWLFPDGLAPSGYFWDSGEKGNKWYGGDIRKPHTKNWHLTRKSGDGLYYVLKQLMLMKKLNIEPEQAWLDGTRGVAEAFANTWKRYGQLGNFIDNVSGDVVVGGSSSGAIVPGAMALASIVFENDAYLELAKEMALLYTENFVEKGLATGGPGDAMQNPDSESAYALVESFSVLYEVTKDPLWLETAAASARQFASWVIAYNYEFPKQSLFGKENMHSLGAVFANAQNKHGAPGICTHSGVGLLRIYRATGDPRYAQLLKDITHSIPQYLNHPVKPIAGTKTGWICERVSTTDWLEGIGEISYLSTWAETALMLTYAEVPGVYVDLENATAFAFDNVEVQLSRVTSGSLSITISNPTALEARVRILVETKTDKHKPLAYWNSLAKKPLVLKPGERRNLNIKRK